MAKDHDALDAEIRDFKRVVKYFKSVSGVLTAICAGLPLGGIFLSALSPPWPPLAHIITFIFILISVCLAFVFYRDCATPATLQAVSKRYLVIGVVAVLVYFALYAKYVVPAPPSGVRVVQGLVLTDEATAAVTSKTSRSSLAKDLLDTFGWESAERIWKYQALVSFLIFVSFLVAGICLANSFFLMVVKNLVRDRLGGAMP
jgi:hypothetical protein